MKKPFTREESSAKADLLQSSILPLFEGQKAMDWNTLLKQGEAELSQAGITDASLDAWYLLAFISGWGRAEFFLHQSETVDETAVERFRLLIRKRAGHIPLQYLTGEQEFMGHSFLVNEHVLVPRQDTELLAEKVLPLLSGRRVLDLCTGSGCLAVSLALAGHAVRVDASDLSEDALAVAQENARRLGADIHFIQSDLWERITGRYDIIVSNPPYIASAVVDGLMPEVREHEPRMALDGGRDGLDFYRRIAARAGEFLSAGGMLWLEIGYDQGQSVPELLKKEGFGGITCYQDYSGNDRVVCGVWTGE